jgi:hypothetical protein
MSDNGAKFPWPGPEYFEKRRNIPPEELLKFAGQYVAFSWDDARIVAADPEEEKLWGKVVAAGVDPFRVVFSYVDDGKGSNLG